VASRIARALLAIALLAPAAWRAATRGGPGRPACEPEGRGIPPAGWIGCRDDPGPRRPLAGPELVLLGRPVDLNAATAADLAAVPGLGPALAAEVVADRAARGPFPAVDALRRVRGIGPARLARARAWLEVPAADR
jgi:competence protein ComEA